MEIVIFVATILVGGAISVALGRRASADLKRARLVRDTPTTPIRDLHGGMAEIVGRVHADGRLLQSPLTQRSCVYYRFRVQQRRAQTGWGAGGRMVVNSTWVTLVDEKQAVPCHVDDGSGRVPLDLWSSQMELQAAVHARSGFLQDPPPELERLLREKYGHDPRGLLFNKSLRYTEAVLPDDGQVYVLGSVQDQGAGEKKVGRGTDGVFVVSDRAPDAVEKTFRQRGVMGMAGAVFTAVVAVGTALAVLLN